MVYFAVSSFISYLLEKSVEVDLVYSSIRGSQMLEVLIKNRMQWWGDSRPENWQRSINC